jgi:DNA-binding transcriptional LysR family regulator
VRGGAGIGVLHDHLARDQGLVRVLPRLRAVRSYWLAVHENLRDVARIRAAADFLTESVREAQPAFTGS